MDFGNPQLGNSVSTANQQNVQLLGTPPIQNASMPTIDPGVLNSTAFQANGNVANMIKALKGGAQ